MYITIETICNYTIAALFAHYIEFMKGSVSYYTVRTPTLPLTV